MNIPKRLTVMIHKKILEEECEDSENINGLKRIATGLLLDGHATES